MLGREGRGEGKARRDPEGRGQGSIPPTPNSAGLPSRKTLAGEHPTPFAQRHPKEAALGAVGFGQAEALASVCEPRGQRPENFRERARKGLWGCQSRVMRVAGRAGGWVLALAPQSRDLPASLIPFSFFYPKLFQWPCRELVSQLGGQQASTELLAPFPPPTHLFSGPSRRRFGGCQEPTKAARTPL